MKPAGLVTVVFGLLAAIVGLWRHLETGDSPQAIWFGAVMGGLAIIGGLLLLCGKRLAGYLLAALALIAVGAWFVHRVASGHAEGFSARVSLILAACVVETIVLVWTGIRKPALAPPSSEPDRRESPRTPG
jgi:hypothetical protein